MNLTKTEYDLDWVERELGFINLPTFEDLSAGHLDLKPVVSKLFDVDENIIISVKKDNDFKYRSNDYVSHFLVDLKGEISIDFYLKKGVPIEPLGNKLLGILTEEEDLYKTISCKETQTFISKGIEGRTIKDLIRRDFTKEVCYNLGKAIELVNALKIGDRHDENLIVNSENKIYHIDCSSLGKTGIEKMFTQPYMGKASFFNSVLQGRKDAKKEIIYQLKNNKERIEALLDYSHVISYTGVPLKLSLFNYAGIPLDNHFFKIK